MITKNSLESLGFKTSGLECGEMIEVEIPNPEKRKPGRYPQKGWTPTIKVMRPAGKVGEHVELIGRPNAFLAFWNAIASNGLRATQPGNHGLLDSFISDTDSSFRGGTRSDLERGLAGNGDLSRFLKAKSQVESSAMLDDVRRELDAINPRRKRVWSDNGQWVEDRRFEPEAFEDFKRQPSPVRTIRFEFECSENCNISADKLAQFGATAWAIVDTLEASGLSVSAALKYTGDNIFPGNKTNILTVELKESGEYISPAFMAGLMNPNFFRRVVFSGLVSLSEACGKSAYASLGQARRFYDAATYDNKTGILRVCSSAVDNPKRLTEVILRAIQHMAGDKNSAAA